MVLWSKWAASMKSQPISSKLQLCLSERASETLASGMDTRPLGVGEERMGNVGSIVCGYLLPLAGGGGQTPADLTDTLSPYHAQIFQHWQENGHRTQKGNGRPPPPHAEVEQAHCRASSRPISASSHKWGSRLWKINTGVVVWGGRSSCKGLKGDQRGGGWHCFTMGKAHSWWKL